MSYYISTPDYYNEYIAHFGVKGMKWGKRKAKLKSDLKWQASKLKNKKLELNAKKLRKKKGVRDADDITNDISKSVYGHGHDNGKANSRTSATRNYQYKIGGKTETVTTSEGYSKQPSEKTRQKAWKNYTYDGVSKDQSGPRYKRIQKNYSNKTTWTPETRSERQAYTYSKTVNNPELKKKAPEGVSTHGGKNGKWTKYNTNAQNFLGADYNDAKKGVYGRHYSTDWESDIGLRSVNNPANKKKKKK